MSPDQDRWRRLVAFDGHAAAFIAYSRQSVDLGVDLGADVAEAEIGRLWALAGRVARDLADWREEIAHLDLARAEPVTPRRAASLISEGFFDDALTPLAHAVFDKALDLAVDARPERGGLSPWTPD